MKYLYSPYNKACPVCANTQNKLLYKVTSTAAARHFVVTHGLDEDKLATVDEKISKLWYSPDSQRGSFALIVVLPSPILLLPVIMNFTTCFRILPRAVPNIGNGSLIKTFKKIAAIAAGNNDLTLLEIGASGGDFIKRISQVVPKKNILCLEYSESGRPTV